MTIATGGAMVPAYATESTNPFASVAVTVKVYAPGAVGVPLTAPLELSVKPCGSDPAVTANTTGAVPPVVCIVWLYAVLMTGGGNVSVVIASAAAIVPLYARVATAALLSVAITVNAKTPAAAGVPLMAPVDAFNVKPDGSEPDVIANVTGALPPDVCTVCAYATLITGRGSVAVVIASAASTVPEYVTDVVVPLASVTVTTKLYEPALDGVPLITPVDVSSVSPAGKVPLEIVNAYGPTPPLVLTVRLYG